MVHMDFYYFTDVLVFSYKDKTLYFVDDDETVNKITQDNWDKSINNYGWYVYEIYNIFDDKNLLKLECGADGDCLFHCLAEAININSVYDNNSSNFYDVISLRKICGSMIDIDNFDLIITNYREETDNNEFIGNWNPYNVDNIKDLIYEIEKCGNNFWGDHIMLQLLGKYFKINIIIISRDIIDICPNIYLVDYKYDNFVILDYTRGCHYQLLGYYNGSYIDTIFNKVPKIINNLLDNKILKRY